MSVNHKCNLSFPYRSFSFCFSTWIPCFSAVTPANGQIPKILYIRICQIFPFLRQIQTYIRFLSKFSFYSYPFSLYRTFVCCNPILLKQSILLLKELFFFYISPISSFSKKIFLSTIFLLN